MAHDFEKQPELSNTQMQFYYWASPHRQIREDFNARVDEVIDGDTIKVDWVERDFLTTIRLSFIDAPEIKESGGTESKSWLERQIEGEEVTIKIDPNNRLGKFGRILGDIIFLGQSMNQLSMDNGHSRRFTDDDIEFR